MRAKVSKRHDKTRSSIIVADFHYWLRMDYKCTRIIAIIQSCCFPFLEVQHQRLTFLLKSSSGFLLHPVLDIDPEK